MKRIILSIFASFLALAGTAQYEISSFTSTGRGGATSFVTDYQAAGINPANLGWASEFEDKNFTMGFNELSFSIHSSAFTKDELREEVKEMIGTKSTDNWTLAEKKQAGRDFANNGLGLNVDMSVFGFSFHSEKFGGIAFRVNDNLNSFMRLGDQASEMLFEGKFSNYFDTLVYVDSMGVESNIANYDIQDADSIAAIANGFANVPSLIGEILNGSRINASWTREYNLSYGRKIIGKDEVFEVFAGVGLKYLQGFAMIDVRSVDNELTAFSATSPRFDIDFGNAAALNPSSLPYQSSGLPQSVGSGFGMDFGLDFLIKKKLKIALALTNVGSMTWKGNIYTINDTLVLNTNSEGLNNFDVINAFTDVTGNDGVFEWNGEKELKQTLATNFRAGASMQLGEIAQIGFDLILPVGEMAPTSLEKAIIGFGGDIKAMPWMRLSAGFVTGGNYDFSIPLGITFIAGKGTWEAGIASRDVVTFFSQNGPTLSLSTGFMRFRF